MFLSVYSEMQIYFCFEQQIIVVAQNGILVPLVAVENFAVVWFLGCCSGAEDSELAAFGL